MADIDPALPKSLLRYDPETGSLHWLSRPEAAFKRPGDAKRWEANFAGKPAITALNSDGYRTGILRGAHVKAHRVAWAIVHGRWPEGQIDHINGDRADNRLANLREVTISVNQRNARLQANSKSGVCGVYWMPSHQRWRAEITYDGQTHRLGLFATKEEAESARLMANDKHGFTERHGQAA